MDTNILLESGTNELEILEFALGDNHYGINVAKIKEISVEIGKTPVEVKEAPGFVVNKILIPMITKMH